MQLGPFVRHASLSRVLLALWLLLLACAAQAGYDPLAVPGTHPTVLDLSIQDPTRDREIPIRVMLPVSSGPAPVILFSHGLGGSRTGSAYLGEHWSARGYVTVYVQHPGSDDAIWRDKSAADRIVTLLGAASLENFALRVQDVRVVLDQLAKWNADPASPLAGRLDMARVGMSGHSFGAVTTEAVSGERFPSGGDGYTDHRIKAAVAFSPSVPRGGDADKAFGQVSIPWMLMTGTKDNMLALNMRAEDRQAVYPALPPGAKYEVVLDRAEHSAFTEHALPGDREPRNPNHHRVILALSTAFWDAWLKSDKAAQSWLEGAGPNAVLQAGDRWQHK